MKIDLASSGGIGEGEILRFRADRDVPVRDRQAGSSGNLAAHLADGARRTVRLLMLLLLAVTVLHVLNANNEINTYVSQFEKRIASRANGHSVFKQSALNHEAEVNQVTQ